MLHLWRADNLGSLADALCDVLSEVPADPLTPEWIAVPSEGMRRWLMLTMSRHLGASDREACDGVAANWITAFPGSLRTAVLDADRRARGVSNSVDPWSVPHLAWEVLAIADALEGDPLLEPIVSRSAPGATYSRARRVADLFDRYALSRPAMLRQWADGRDLDPTGTPLADSSRWQPHLWRLLVSRLGPTGPAHRLDPAIKLVREGSLALDLPERLIIFGISTLPGGVSFTSLVEAIAMQRSVNVFVVEPSPALTRDVESLAVTAPAPLRADDPSQSLVRNTLLSQWGAPFRESAVVRRSIASSPVAPRARPSTLLGRIQRDLASNVEPDGNVVPDRGDESIVLHACAGPIRQVEALRNTIARLLGDHARGLRPEDIVVFAGNLDATAPLIESVFASPDVPVIPVRVTDRSLRTTNPALEVIGTALEMIAGRFTSSSVLGFLGLEAVRLRLSFDDDELATVATWVDELGVRWGIGSTTVARYGLPENLVNHTWDRALDALYLGLAFSDDDERAALGDVFPVGLEGHDLSLLGRVTAALAVLEQGSVLAGARHPLATWCAWLDQVIDTLVGALPDQAWTIDEARRIVNDLNDVAASPTVPTELGLDAAEVTALLADSIEGAPGHPSFFRGGVTVTSMTPMQWIPFKVICLVDIDAVIADAGTIDGDDLAIRHPRVGDREQGSEGRQAMLAALLSAEESLHIFRTGFDVQKNRDVEAPIVIAELRDAIVRTLAPGASANETFERQHPRHEFDPESFADALGGSASVDARAYRAACARTGQRLRAQGIFDAPFERVAVEEITLNDLRSMLSSPLEAFLRQRLGIRLRFELEARDEEIPLSLSPLERSRVGRALARRVVQGRSVTALLDALDAHGQMPPGVFGVGERLRFSHDAAAMSEAFASATHSLASSGTREVSIDLGGRRLVGSFDAWSDSDAVASVSLTYRRPRSTSLLDGWVDLLALVASGWQGPCRATRIERCATSKSGVDDSWVTRHLTLIPNRDQVDLARRQLTALCDLYEHAMAQPLPLFPELGRLLTTGRAKEKDWRDGTTKEGDTEAVALVFGAMDLDELLRLPARDTDPGEGAFRAVRLAHVIWDAFDASVRVANDLDGVVDV